MAKTDDYRRANAPLPSEHLAWQVFGAGFENLGKDGKPTTIQRRDPAENEVLCRVDALGLCLSDIKIINQGGNHPRLRGRDLANDPTVLGHEASVTVVKVGAKWADQFRVGDRFIVQADIYYKGVNNAFGYMIPGGLQQYCLLDEQALDGDEGCYLLPVQASTGYSQAALSEPWACVEMSYNLQDRLEPAGGELLIVTDDEAEWRAGNPQALIIPRSLEGLGDEKFDDVILPSPTPEMVESLVPRLRKGGCMFLLGDVAEQGTASVDIGRIHYENIRIYGGGQDMVSVAKVNSRNDLEPDGAALFIGAGGPMGQMHVQRAIEIPSGAKTVVVTDLDRARLDHIVRRFGDLAKAKGVELHTFSPSEFASQGAMDARTHELAPNGYSDVCVLAPIPALVRQAVGFAADGALLNVFAGIPIGNPADLELTDLCRGVKIIGSSGSRISDLRKILDMVERGDLNSDMSVAAIGGLNCARVGLEGVKAGRFPGKTVIYPQIPELPLMAIEEIPEKLPEVAPKLGPGGAWTREAEAALLENHL